MSLVQIGGGLPFTPNYGWADPEVSGLLQAQWGRNPATFQVNKWTKLVPTRQMQGLIQVLDPANGARVVNVNDYQWPQGNDPPRGEQDWFTESSFVAQRFAPTFNIPVATAQQLASIGVDTVAGHASTHAQKAMTIRTINAVTAATTTGNWGSNYSAAPSGVGGGNWTGSSVANQYIKKTIQGAQLAIMKSSGGAIQANEISMLCGPAVAQVISQAPEFTDFVKQMGLSLDIMRGTANVVDPYGIPKNLYGLKEIVVDMTMRVTSQSGASSTTVTPVMGNSVVFYTNRSDVPGITGGWDWSTIQIFSFQNLEVSTEYQQFEERIRGKVVETHAAKVAVPQSGYLISDVLS